MTPVRSEYAGCTRTDSSSLKFDYVKKELEASVEAKNMAGLVGLVEKPSREMILSN